MADIVAENTKGFYVDELGLPHLQIVGDDWFINQEGQKVDNLTGNIWNVAGEPRYLITITPPYKHLGEFALSADVGTVVQTTEIIAQESSFSLTADTATLDVDLQIEAQEGNYTLTADEGTVTQTSIITADEGLFSLTADIGEAVATTEITAQETNFTLTAEQGTVSQISAITGQDGFFNLTADNATVIQTTEITADETTFSLTADEGSLTQPATIEAQEGNFSLTADNGVVQATSVISASEATFNLTADNAQVIQTTEITPAESSFTLTADNGVVVPVTEIVGAEGNFTLTSDSGAVISTSVIEGAESTFSLTADSGSVAQTTEITAQEGAFTLTADNGTVTIPVPDNARVTSTGGYRVTSTGDYRVTNPTTINSWHDFGFSDSWLADDLSSTPVASWANGQGGTALSSSGTAQPAYSATSGPNSQPGVTFDGTNDYLEAAIGTKAQPQSYVFVFKYVSSNDFDWLFDSSDSGGRQLFGRGSGGTWEIYAGTVRVAGTVDTDWHAGIAYFNGASSELELDNTSIISANAGTQSLNTSLILGTRFLKTTYFSNIVVSAFGVYNGDARTDPNWNELVSYVNNKWGLTL